MSNGRRVSQNGFEKYVGGRMLKENDLITTQQPHRDWWIIHISITLDAIV